MYIALYEVPSPLAAQKLQRNAYLRTSPCVPGSFNRPPNALTHSRPVPSGGTEVEFPNRGLPDSLALEQTWGRLFGRFETRKSLKALLNLGLISSQPEGPQTSS
jgi:hypothetical protein